MMENRRKTQEEICQVFRFEQWLRFYFVEERDDKLFLNVPEERMAEIKAAYPHLVELANIANGGEIDYQKSCDMVCAFVGAHIDGPKHSTALVTNILDSKGYQVEMYLFGLWIKGHEDFLDEEFRPFSEWEELYSGWRATEQVADYARKLMESSPAATTAGGSNTVH